MKKNILFYLFPLLSGFFIGTSYIPFPPWALFFSYVPLWFFVFKQKRLKPILIGSWLCQFTATLIGFNWVAYTIREFGFFSWPLAILGLLVFASFANLHIPISLFLWFITKKLLNKTNLCSLKTHFILILFPIYSAFCMEYYPMMFKWNWGYSWLYAGWPAFQTAEIWGFKFLNTLTLFFNYFVLFFVLQQRKAGLPLPRVLISFAQSRSWKWSQHKNIFALSSPSVIFLLAGCFLALNLWGWYLKARWPEPDKSLSVLLIQPNIENLSKSYKESQTDPRPLAWKKLVQETEKYLNQVTEKPDFILWPEGSYPYAVYHDFIRKTPAQQVAQKWQVPIVFSATGIINKRTSNSIFIVDEKGKKPHPPYNKTLLLAFGEYMPGEKWLPTNKIFSYYGRSFIRGKGENNPIKLGEAVLGLQICYEGIFDFFSRNLAKKQTQVLLNVTNDSWYGSWQEPWQHLYMTLARAIEIRRPMVRGTNTGLSTFIKAHGEIEKISQFNTSAGWLQKVPYSSLNKKSIFTLWGYYINIVFLWFSFFCILAIAGFSYWNTPKN